MFVNTCLGYWNVEFFNLFWKAKGGGLNGEINWQKVLLKKQMIKIGDQQRRENMSECLVSSFTLKKTQRTKKKTLEGDSISQMDP